MFAGIRDASAGNDTLFSQQQFQELMGRFQKEMQQKQQVEAAKEATINKEKGKAYMEANAKKEGVMQTASGLQYKILRDATGPKPTATNTVKVNYEGRLIDGTIFDSSYERGQPIEFGLGQVIKGWTEGLQLMSVGSMYELTIPSELGYGDRPMQTIPAGSTLIFKVELLEFK
ncbi:Outer membrane protein MIP [bioreactor metagenome]|uniref:peptidylprolyl isomerase n=1 Tax=bioreactor metagenome TaxID=1076179 RepID=A0A644WFU8_9ZZZZ